MQVSSQLLFFRNLHTLTMMTPNLGHTLLSDLLELPRHPPYLNELHCLYFLSKYHRSSLPVQTPSTLPLITP